MGLEHIYNSNAATVTIMYYIKAKRVGIISVPSNLIVTGTNQGLDVGNDPTSENGVLTMEQTNGTN